MGKSKRIINELGDGYNAVALAMIEESSGNGSEVTYEVGYADGWADALHHAAWASEGKPEKIKRASPLFAARRTRRAAQKELKARRAEKL